MTVDIRPWRQLLPVWLPAVVFCVAAVAFFFYQTSDSVGRRATIAADIVGMTVITGTARRAYELADALRSRGFTVVLGDLLCIQLWHLGSVRCFIGTGWRVR